MVGGGMILPFVVEYAYPHQFRLIGAYTRVEDLRGLPSWVALYRQAGFGVLPLATVGVGIAGFLCIYRRPIGWVRNSVPPSLKSYRRPVIVNGRCGDTRSGYLRAMGVADGYADGEAGSNAKADLPGDGNGPAPAGVRATEIPITAICGRTKKPPGTPAATRPLGNGATQQGIR